MRRGAGDGLARLAEAQRELEALRRRVRTRLRTAPLSGALAETSGWRHASAEDLRAAGFVPEVLGLFADPADPSTFRPRPAVEGLALVAEAPSIPLGAVRLQIPTPARGVALGLAALRDLARSLDPQTAVVLVVRPGVRAGALRGLWRGWGLDPDRLRIVEHETTTIFAQDNGKGARVGGSAALLLPLTGDGREARDALSPDPPDLGVPAHRSCLRWDGGNLLRDEHSTLVGANTVALNQLVCGLEADQILAQLEAESGAPALVLGDLDEAREALIALQEDQEPENAREGGQADFHIDLDVSPLDPGEDGRPRVAIADPVAGAELAAAVERGARRFAHHFVDPAAARRIFRRNLEVTVERRLPHLERYRNQLEARGYVTFGIPDVRIARQLDYLNRANFTLNYVNVLAGSRDGRPAVRSFVYGVPELDEAAAGAWAAAGADLVPVGDPVLADEVLGWDGGPHCVASRLW